MNRWLAIAGLVLLPAISIAGGPTTPDYVRIQQGNSIPQPTPVPCATASTPLWNNPAATPNGAGNLRSISFTNVTGTAGVYICPATTCSSTSATWYLAANKGAGVVIDRSVRDISWSCLGDGSSQTVAVGPEQ